MRLALTIEDATSHDAAVDAVIAAGRDAAQRHWVPATSGNFSVRIDSARIAITRSGVDKGALSRADILVQDLDAALRPGSSAEAALHVGLYRDNTHINAIFHTHGPASTVIGRAHVGDKAVRLHGWELQKALAGVTTHEATVEVPVFANDQDVQSLSQRVAKRLARKAPKGCTRAPGYLLAGHGLYAWGQTPAEAGRHIEALEALFAQMLALRSYQP